MNNIIQDIVVAYGDGIGPEIMEAVLEILRAVESPLRFDTIEIGEAQYKKGWASGITESAWEKIKKSKILLKAPITTPMGGGYKSLNVTLRKKLGLNINLRPCRTYTPYIGKKEMNIAFVRENAEDLYCGIEFQRHHGVYECIKLTTEENSTKIAQYAFEYAMKNGRKKVTCMVKDNIMKMTDGCFYKAFEKVAAHYPEIEKEHYIIDIGSARIAAKPEIFDVVLSTNLYGDIISDIGAEVAGSVGIAGSANLGGEYAMFEAIHGSAPTMHPDTANPSGLLHAAIMMLRHLQLHDKADLIENAWLSTIEQGFHTKDLHSDYTSKIVGTKEFTQKVIENLGQDPQKITPVKTIAKNDNKNKNIEIPLITDNRKKELIGVDITMNVDPITNPDPLVQKINENLTGGLQVRGMSHKGLLIWPHDAMADTSYKYVKVRIASSNIMKREHMKISYQEIAESLKNLEKAGIDIARVDSLYAFDDDAGFSPPQGA